MKKKFKTLSVLISAVMCASVLGLTAGAYYETANVPDNEYELEVVDEPESGYVYDGIYYDIDGDFAYVYDADADITRAEIPDMVGGCPVTMITAYAFSACEKLEEITVPSCLSYIDVGAFDNTAWYESQPDGPVYIGNVLYDYKGDIPENTSVEVREGTISISPYAFAGEMNTETYEVQETTGLVSVQLPEIIELIGYKAFESCTGLENITVPENQHIVIEYDAFKNTAWYNAQPDGPVYAGSVLYRYKGKTPENTDLVLREDTKVICASAFYPDQDENSDEEIANTGLKSITLPEGLEYIGDGAFQSCQSLAEISIPDRVSVIGAGAFFNCTSLSSVKLPKNIGEIGMAQFALCESLKTIELPENVGSIGDIAFMGSGLTDVEIPEYVYYIGSGAFYCPSLKNITVPNPRCIIEDESSVSNYVDDEGTMYYYGTIKGYANSYADIYAQNFGYTFDGSLGVIGDISDNGKIDLYDAIRIAEYIMNMRTFDDNMLMIADYNLDYVVNLYDVIAIAAELLPK